MAAKIEINVPVDAASFSSFYEVFKQFNAASESMPDAWKQATAESQEMREQFRASAENVRTVADQMDAILDSVDKLNDASRETSMSWKGMASSAKLMSGHIKDATLSLLKWAGITSVVGGLLGTGGLFGLDSLARGVANTRQAAMGNDTSFGSYNAFNVNYGRLGDPAGILGRISYATHDANGRKGLASLGLSEADMKGDTADVAAKAIDRLGNLVDKIPDNVLGNQLEARGLNDIFGLEYAIRLKRTPKNERAAMAKDFQRDRKTLDLDKETQRAWQEFSTQMKRAKESFENILTKALIGLEPGLFKLSDAFTELLATLLKENGPVSHWIDEFGHGLEWLATHLDDPSFRESVNHVLEWVEKLGRMLWKLGKAVIQFGEWLGVSTAAAAGAPKATITEEERAAGFTENGPAGDGHFGGRRGLMSHGAGGGDPTPYHGSAGVGGWWKQGDHMEHAIQRLMKESGLSRDGAEGLVARWAGVESGGGPTSVNPHGGAWGVAQWLPKGRGRTGYTTDFDKQLDKAIGELNGPESHARAILRKAQNAHEGALGAAAFERAEGWNGRYDSYTSKSEAASAGVRAHTREKKPEAETPKQKTSMIILNRKIGADSSYHAATAGVPA